MSAIKTFTEGKIFTPLLRFSMPILFALLLNEIPSRGFQRVTQTIT